MECYYMKEECVLFLEYIAPDDMYKHAFTYHFFCLFIQEMKIVIFDKEKEYNCFKAGNHYL